MIKTAFSLNKNVNKAVNEIKDEMMNLDNIVSMVYFASSTYPQKELAKTMKESFPGVKLFGCSTTGENFNGRIMDNSIVVMGFSNEILEDVKIEVVKDLDKNLNKKVSDVFLEFDNYYNIISNSINVDKYVGLVFTDGLSGVEEKLMDSISNKTDIFFVGGSAGDDLKFEKTFVYADGKVYNNAAILALLKPKVKFDILKTQSFKQLDKKLVVTKADEKNRKVLEFNNKPATLAYAESIGCEIDKVDDYFMSNPIGLIIDGEPYVRSPQRIEDTSMYFYCEIQEGMEVSLLKSEDISKQTKKDLDDKNFELQSVKKVEAIIDFNCILRKIELINKDNLDQYAECFANVPTVGFCTYGEAYLGHINQTSTMLIFGK